MVYTRLFNPLLVPSLGILTSCAKTHSDPFIYANLVGEIVGVNPIFMDFFGFKDVNEIPPLEEWLDPQGAELSSVLSQSGQYRAKVIFESKMYDMALRTEVMVLGDEFVIAMVFRDTSALERAKAAERYFDKFKKKLLTNISHEFRTPMNAIIGFVDLLSSSPLSSWQQEYVDLAGKSAHSMMRNIENLLELMQVESGGIQTHMREFNPFDVFESFSMQFEEQIASKEIQWSVLIDPRLPIELMGDQDKIITILRNLIQNAIKFTPVSGQVLLEIMMVKKNHATIEVEYAISDTGIGIDSTRMKTLLRPFSSAWENQRHGQDGMGVGLSLSHKYIEMMDSSLMLASEVGRGSRFSFRLVHPINDPTYLEVIEGKRVALYAYEPLSTQSVLLEKYLELFELQMTPIASLVNPDLNQCDVLLIDVPHLSSSQVETIKSIYPHLQIVAVVDKDYHEREQFLRGLLKAVITPPLLPTNLHKALAHLEKTVMENILEKPNAEGLIQSIKNAKILVAEDNPINLRLLETILKQNAYIVKGVENGQKAVDSYLKEKFDLVLMDIDMPVMDGLTANRLIKEIDKHDSRGFVPVIALTAHALIGDRERIIKAGLDAHLAKPIDKSFLLQTIERYLKMAYEKKNSGIV
jgi:signal transduction histidine kinase/ActR/RegA family two-component response regulator